MATAVKIRRRIDVSGLVQGVGFRPFVYRLAAEAGLSGSVRNNASGVAIEVQGQADSVDGFLIRLRSEAPPLSQIVQISVSDLASIDETDFRIVESQKDRFVQTLISPDVTVCDDCLREIFDPADRRFRYPLVNCTNCGPRFTIVRGIPYDRRWTSMAPFPMCAACQAEYDDPRSRRFHAQPNACWTCGPKLELWDANGNLLAGRDPIVGSVDALRAGGIVAVKGLGGFHLAADALNVAAVRLLRERKRRLERPFAVMVPDLETAAEFCQLSAGGREALQSYQRPIVLLKKKEPCAISEPVAPNLNEIGVFLPYTPLQYLLFREGGFKALVMTSGNLSDEPIAIGNLEARDRLRELADFYLVHDREILLRCDDSVVRVSHGQTRQLRRSRGFVPVPFQMHEDLPPILALGGDLKNTICLTSGRQAFLSQHIGDLENPAAYSFLEEVIAHLERVLEIQPTLLAHDLHPGYFSTQWARGRRGLPLVGVQHHHAHIASCMAENHLDGKVIGFAFDGTGFGADGHIWGGEGLIADYRSFTRVAHFDYVPMPGGEAAVREPGRMALAYLWHYFGRDFAWPGIPALQNIGRGKIELLFQMMERRVNSPLTSSCGRLFDAVAALAGIRQRVTYEGQAAIELESAMDPSSSETGYPFELISGNGGWIVGMHSMFEALLHDLGKGLSPGIVSARFHQGIVDVWVRLANLVRERTSLNRICLSGGTLNNQVLTQRFIARLERDDFAVFTQSRVPCGDGGLSLGQALVASHNV
jgi:hydrogenase maturation protein HypF